MRIGWKRTCVPMMERKVNGAMYLSKCVYSGLCGDDTEDGNKASAHRAWVSEVP